MHTDDSKKLLSDYSGEKPEPPAAPKEKVSIGQVIELLKKKEYRTKLVACGMYACMYIYVSMYATCMYVCIYMFVTCMFVCMYEKYETVTFTYLLLHAYS